MMVRKVEHLDPISWKQNMAMRQNIGTEESITSYIHQLLMNSKKMISRLKKTIFRRLSFTHYPNQRTKGKAHWPVQQDKDEDSKQADDEDEEFQH